MTRLHIVLLALALALLISSVWALSASPAAITLQWWTVDAGGGTFSARGYTLAGTIGQPDAGPTLSNGGYSLTGGFWTGVTALERYPVYLPLVVRNQ